MNFNAESKSGKRFCAMVDELVEIGRTEDADLLDGIHWLDGQAFKKGISFYEMVFQTLLKYDISKRSRDWMTCKYGDCSYGNCQHGKQNRQSVKEKAEN